MKGGTHAPSPSRSTRVCRIAASQREGPYPLAGPSIPAPKASLENRFYPTWDPPGTPFSATIFSHNPSKSKYFPFTHHPLARAEFSFSPFPPIPIPPSLLHFVNPVRPIVCSPGYWTGLRVSTMTIGLLATDGFAGFVNQRAASRRTPSRMQRPPGQTPSFFQSSSLARFFTPVLSGLFKKLITSCSWASPSTYQPTIFRIALLGLLPLINWISRQTMTVQ